MVYFLGAPSPKQVTPATFPRGHPRLTLKKLLKWQKQKNSEKQFFPAVIKRTWVNTPAEFARNLDRKPLCTGKLLKLQLVHIQNPARALQHCNPASLIQFWYHITFQFQTIENGSPAHNRGIFFAPSLVTNWMAIQVYITFSDSATKVAWLQAAL